MKRKSVMPVKWSIGKDYGQSGMTLVGQTSSGKSWVVVRYGYAVPYIIEKFAYRGKDAKQKEVLTNIRIVKEQTLLSPANTAKFAGQEIPTEYKHANAAINLAEKMLPR